MRLNFQSQVWPLLTLPVLVACLALGVSLVVSINRSHTESMHWARCEDGLNTFRVRLQEYHAAYRDGDAARADAARQPAHMALRALPEGCADEAELRQLTADTRTWLEETAVELASRAGWMPGRSEAAFGRVVRQFDLLSLRTSRRKTDALSGPLAKWKDAVALSLLASVLALLALLLHRTYRREMRHRREVEQELRRSETRYRELFEHVAEGLYQTSPSGEILRANPALVRMLGFESEQEIRRVDIGASLYADPEQRRQLTALLERDGHLRNVELRLRRRDGTELVALENARAVRGPGGAVLWYEGSLADITARKQAERVMAEQMRELEAARSKSEQQAYQLLDQSFDLATARDEAVQSASRKLHFLVNLSTEFRAPMNGVAGMAQLLLDSELSMQQREFAESVKKSAGRLLETIDEILEYARIDQGEVSLRQSEFSLRGLVAGLLHRHAAQAENKGVEIAALVKRDVPDVITGDGVRLGQVMSNLLQNAIRMTDSGTVSFTIGAVSLGGREVLLRVQVEDTGAGIPQERMAALFDPFARSVSSRELGYERSGMNLAISRKLVERMGGQMGVESEPGQGSLFWFQVSLPYGECAASAGDPLEWNGQRCLIVHDNIGVRGVIAELMSGWGIHALSASDEAEALVMLRQADLLGEPFDLLLVDNELPGQPGVALAGAVLDDPGCGHPQILLLVPHSQRAYCLEPTLLGIAAMIAKPVEERVLRATLARVATRFPAAAPQATASLLQLERVVQKEPAGAILLVEDDPIGQRVGKRLLEKLGYETIVVNNGLEACQAVQEYRFSAILMDLMMPGMDGVTATRAIRAMPGIDPRLPIIAMSASDATSERERCLTAGMNDFLSKPASLDQLRTVVGRWTSPGHARSMV
ncbi:MAG: response regulator [Bryobacterales bacterium]|nr:response regulator [Bryobacterales bacterium]